jgi:serine/threonine-protein kinase RsbT
VSIAEPQLRISGEEDIVRARQAVRLAAQKLGFSLLDQSRIATAVSEITRNVVRYASDARGEMALHELVSTDRGTGIEIVVSDSGPGIPDIAKALEPGYTSGTGLGMGLPGTRRLMDEMEIQSGSQGTTVTIRKWVRRR